MWNAPQDMHDLVAQLPDGLAVYQPRQKYFLLDENQIAENILDKAGGPSAWLFRLERASPPDKFREILRELSQVF